MRIELIKYSPCSYQIASVTDDYKVLNSIVGLNYEADPCKGFEGLHRHTCNVLSKYKIIKVQNYRSSVLTLWVVQS